MVALVLTTTLAAMLNQAALHVGATVVPHCRFSVDSASDGRAASVTASCAASNLRSLRVSTSGGHTLQPRTVRHLLAGGDVVYLVSRVELPGRDGRDVIVTLDF